MGVERHFIDHKTVRTVEGRSTYIGDCSVCGVGVDIAVHANAGFRCMRGNRRDPGPRSGELGPEQRWLIEASMEYARQQQQEREDAAAQAIYDEWVRAGMPVVR